MTNISYRHLFILMLISIFLVRIYILWLNSWPINGDEAQYWNWSQNLAWGYYSKPPMIAWVIALTTKLFGSGAIGLRFGSTLSYFISAIFIYLTGYRLFSERVGFWSGIIFILIPGVSFSSTIISTDPLLLMFWCIAFYCLVRALEKNELHWWFLSAVALSLAFYSKYAAILFTISLIIFLLISKNHRYLLKTAGPYIVVLVPFILLIPNIIWNYQHNFASIAAVSANANLSKDFFHPGNFLNFFLSQFAIFGPILLVILLIIFLQIPRYLKNDHYKLLLVFCLVTLGIMTLESLISRAHANWSAPAYIAATLLVCAVIIEQKRMVWLWLTLVLYALVQIGFMNIQALENKFHLPLDQKMTIIGWKPAMSQINLLHTQYPEAKLLVDDRMLLTQIMYYGQIPLEKTIRWNPSGIISDQYDMVTTMKNQIGNDFLLLSYASHPFLIENAFSSAKLIATINLMTLDGQSIPLYIYYLAGFKGY